MMTTIFNIYFTAILPSAFILVLACLVLLLAVFSKRKADDWVYYITQLGLLVTIAMLVQQYHYFSHAVAIAHDRFRIDHFSILGSLAILLLSMASLFFSRQELSQHKLPSGEYYSLCLFSILGMLVMTTAYHFLTLYIAIELMSFPLYVLCAYYRGSNKGVEASLKYFVTGALASGFLLYGISLVYGVTHSLSFTNVGMAITNITAHDSVMLLIGLAFVLAGFVFKLGLAPFHMWLPDVYEGASSSVVTFLAAAPKVAAFILFLRLLESAFVPVAAQWGNMLAFIAIISMLIGNLAALTQKNLRRMLAYSSIAQMGFIVMGLVVGNIVGLSAAFFYMLTYAVISLAVFGIISLLNAEKLEDLAGLHRNHPFLAMMLLLFMFSMAGIPPLVGFMAKLSILLALINAHYIAMTIFMALMSVVGLYYYLNIVKVMYFDESTSSLSPRLHRMSVLLLAMCGLFALLIGLFPASLYNQCLSALT